MQNVELLVPIAEDLYLALVITFKFFQCTQQLLNLSVEIKIIDEIYKMKQI